MVVVEEGVVELGASGSTGKATVSLMGMNGCGDATLPLHVMEPAACRAWMFVQSRSSADCTLT